MVNNKNNNNIIAHVSHGLTHMHFQLTIKEKLRFSKILFCCLKAHKGRIVLI